MRGIPVLAAIALSLLTAWPARPRALSPYADWAAIVVSGDDHAAHGGQPTRTFDNARRDVAAALEKRGFSAANLIMFSASPAARAEAGVRPADAGLIVRGLETLTARARSGCLIYFTSHGAPQGLVLGDKLLPPSLMGSLVTRSCGERPAVVIVSACFSGIFIPALSGPDRMVLTAARRDRSSFGCGESDRYPYFDGCILEALPKVRDFLLLAAAARACVARREHQEHMRPPSQPQLSVGAAIRPRLAASPFPPG
ncbi:MAG TPA: C13 family peptidase [Caulobacteraceae bacterium]|nr:C13 family peptidase [Caulobacteraceae bacterium]